MLVWWEGRAREGPSLGWLAQESRIREKTRQEGTIDVNGTRHHAGTGHDDESMAGDGLLGGTTLSRRTVMKAAVAGAASGMVAGELAAQDQSASPITQGPGGESLPNILVIMADDIGYWNVSAYNMGMMGYRTPNIDRIADEGVKFTDAYGEQSCTAGRSAFITGQHPFRTGLLSIGMPGEDHGLNEEDPTLAQLLKPLGYATGQFGKNHLGDLNKYLPTVHGFDEFFGNLYHLNAEEEPENPDYPDDPEFYAKYGPRGVLHTWASDVDDPTEDPRFGPVGRQVIEDTGPLNTERMETIDEELLGASIDFMTRSVNAGQPFFNWFNPTRMHIWTHLKPESDGATGLGSQADGMVELDNYVGRLLQWLDDTGIADNTIVIFTTENGAQVFSWPDGNMTPFRSEKNSNWEGAYRIPMMMRWPQAIPARTISNGIMSLQDLLPTLMAAAGQPQIKEQLLVGYEADGRTFNIHLDGYNQLDHIVNGTDSAREEFYYFNDDGDLVGLREGRWKYVFMEQRGKGLDVWFEPFVDLRTPRLIDLLGDPFERAPEESENYDIWMLERIFLFTPAKERINEFLRTFVAFPPRGATERIERIRNMMENMQLP
jgi:arylsulfatase A-like enzyme